MSTNSTNLVRNLITATMIAIVLASVAAWYLGRERVPTAIRIATGKEGGLYFAIGETIKEPLATRTGRRVATMETSGTEHNKKLLEGGTVEFAVFQGAPNRSDNFSVVTPLFQEFLFVIVRRGSGIKSLGELRGKNVCIGEKRSGTRRAATLLLEHYGLRPEDLGRHDGYFVTMLNDSKMDGAIVVAGVENQHLRDVLGSGHFDLLPIHVAPAIDLIHPNLRQVEIPAGLFATEPRVPAVATPTIATTAYLVARNDAPASMVRAALESVHEENLRVDMPTPTLISRESAGQFQAARFHPTARRYFNPSDNIGLMANVMESLAATKELLFALAAGIYILWLRWRNLKEKESRERISKQKEHIDRLLLETLRIEQKQGKSKDMAELEKLLDELTRIKVKALHEFTEEELRGDQTFIIFLDQCTRLAQTIQLRMIALLTGVGDPNVASPAGDGE